MKTFLIVFCSFALVAIITILTYNSDKGPAKQKDGITELPQPSDDSLLNRGKYLISQTNFNDQDLKAIAAYLDNR
jgi:hypothetical protein